MPVDTPAPVTRRTARRQASALAAAVAALEAAGPLALVPERAPKACGAGRLAARQMAGPGLSFGI